jgi:hypothetical protein
MEFARRMYDMWPGVYTPELVNARMKDINLNPLAGTEAQINEALLSPKENEDKLVGFSEYFEMIDMLYKREVLYLGNMLSWDMTFTCVNAKEEDYKTLAYKKDEKALSDFLTRFDYKKEFKRILRQIIRQETYYGVLRDDTDDGQYTIQELPYNYCKITGRWSRGFLFDFNMYHFMLPGVSIDMYPPIFKQYWKRFKSGKMTDYNPAVSIDSRTGKYVYWMQTSPDDGMWAFKFSPELAAQIPFFAPTFADLVQKPLVRSLQKNRYIIEASKVLIGLIGFNEGNKSGNVRDALKLSPETCGKFAQLIRQGLASEIQFGIAPFERIESFEWKSDNVNILDQFNRVTVGQSGTNAKLLYTTSDKMNMVETKNSIAIDEQVAEHAYPYFADFLNYYANKRTKRFKFKFTFEGTNMPESRAKRLADVMQMAQMGVVLPQKFSAALGMDYFDFNRQLEQGRADEFVDKLTPIMTSYTMSPGGGGAGRPEKPENDLSDEGVETRTQGSNIDKGA